MGRFRDAARSLRPGNDQQLARDLAAQKAAKQNADQQRAEQARTQRRNARSRSATRADREGQAWEARDRAREHGGWRKTNWDD